jgi:hypothetical protein
MLGSVAALASAPLSDRHGGAARMCHNISNSWTNRCP